MFGRKAVVSQTRDVEGCDFGMAQRLRLAIGSGRSLSAWARQVGIAVSTLHGILEKGATPTTKNLVKIALATDISLNWLLVQRGPQRVDGGNAESLPCPGGESDFAEKLGKALYDEERFMLPRVGRLAQQLGLCGEAGEQLAEELAFRARWLRNRLQVDPDRILLVRVKGDGMVPTLRDGDVVMVDVRKETVGYDAIYALKIDGVLTIKRLQRDLDGSLIVHSDNAEYERIVIHPREVLNLKVVGMVVWVGRQL